MVHEGDKQTVVWVANRDDPVINATGALGWSTDGTILVWDTTSKDGIIYWTSGTNSWCDLCTNTTAKLTDSGNLVLYEYEYEYEYEYTPVWESFKNPTDTFLPGMSKDSNLILTSWRDRDDPGRGNFTFKKTLKRRDDLLENRELWSSPSFK